MQFDPVAITLIFSIIFLAPDVNYSSASDCCFHIVKVVKEKF